MILSDDEFHGLQTLQQRMLDEALERSEATTLAEGDLAAIAARLALVAQIDVVVGASYGTPDADEADDDDADEEDVVDELADVDDEPLRAARRLSSD